MFLKSFTAHLEISRGTQVEKHCSKPIEDPVTFDVLQPYISHGVLQFVIANELAEKILKKKQPF